MVLLSDHMVKWAWVSNRSGQRFRRTGLLVDVGAVGKKCLEMGNLVLEFFKFPLRRPSVLDIVLARETSTTDSALGSFGTSKYRHGVLSLEHLCSISSMHSRGMKSDGIYRVHDGSCLSHLTYAAQILACALTHNCGCSMGHLTLDLRQPTQFFCTCQTALAVVCLDLLRFASFWRR